MKSKPLTAISPQGVEVTFPSRSYFAKHIGTSPSNVQNHIDGATKHVKGWKVKEDR